MIFCKYVLYDENLAPFLVHLFVKDDVQGRLYTLNCIIWHD